MKLAVGEFLGIPIKIRSVAGFTFTEYRYPKGIVLRRHSHELAYFSFVLNGSYVERCFSSHLKHCRRETALYHPAEEDHADTFGKRGGWIFSMEVGPTWMHRLQDYELKTGEPLDAHNRTGTRLESAPLQSVPGRQSDFGLDTGG
jgi:hypothetical protein